MTGESLVRQYRPNIGSTRHSTELDIVNANIPIGIFPRTLTQKNAWRIFVTSSRKNTYGYAPAHMQTHSLSSTNYTTSLMFSRDTALGPFELNTSLATKLMYTHPTSSPKALTASLNSPWGSLSKPFQQHQGRLNLCPFSALYYPG